MLKKLPQPIWISTGATSGFWQEVCYENLPPYCSHCLKIGHSSSNCRKIVGANDSKGKEVAAISSLAKKGVRPQEETGLVAYKSATYDKQQWVPKPSTTESTVAVANSKTQTSKTVVEKIIQSNYHPVRLPQSHDAAGASQEPDTLEALEVRNASAKKV